MKKALLDAQRIQRLVPDQAQTMVFSNLHQQSYTCSANLV